MWQQRICFIFSRRYFFCLRLGKLENQQWTIKAIMFHLKNFWQLLKRHKVVQKCLIVQQSLLEKQNFEKPPVRAYMNLYRSRDTQLRPSVVHFSHAQNPQLT